MIPDELRKILLSPIRPGRVGKDGKGFSHVEAYEIRAHLIRLFDFDGWDSEVLDMQEIYDTEKDGKFTVCYRARVRLKVCWPDEPDTYSGGYSVFSEWATGEAKNQPSRGDAHDLAIKTAESQALKRCAMNLGDQYGLSLYKKGSTDALVRQTWHSTVTTAGSPPAVDEHVTESVPESEQQDSGAAPAREYPAPNPECGKCHFFHRPDGVCPPGQPGPGRNKDGSIDQRKLPKDVKAQRKQTEAAHEALVEEVMGDDKGPERGPVEDMWAGQPTGTLNMPAGSAAKLAKDLLEEVAACVSVDMVEATVQAAREALADERLAFPQLGPIVAAGTARAREITEDEQGHGAGAVAS